MNKIDINKQYKTRNGLPVKIYSVSCDNNKNRKKSIYSVYGAFFVGASWASSLWSKNGLYEISKSKEHFLDLIEL